MLLYLTVEQFSVLYSSHHAKVDPIEQTKRRAHSPSAYVAAMEEFRNGGDYDSASEEI